jgi:uncharacterized protein (TIGR03435 family)
MTAIAQLFSLPLAHALGWTLLHFCWQGAMAGVLLACVLGLLPLRASRLRYASACAAMALMFVLPAITFCVLAANTQTKPQQPSIAFTAEQQSYALNNSFSRSAEPWTAHQSAETWTVRLEGVIDQSLAVVIGCWFAGVLILLCRLNLGLLAVRRMKSLTIGSASLEIQQILRSLCTRLRMQRTIVLLNSARVQAPTVIGWLKPAILLPIGCMTGLSSLQIEAILAHELAHIRRHDYLVSMFQSVMETIFFYHPAVWWVSTRMRREREHCCDDLAVELCGDRIAYARALSFLEEQRSAALVGVFGATGGVLKMRIARLLSTNRPLAFPRALAVILLVFVVATAGLTVLGSARAQSISLQQRKNSDQNSGGQSSASYRSATPQDIRFNVASIHPLKEMPKQVTFTSTSDGFDSGVQAGELVKIAYAPETPIIAIKGAGGVSKVLNLPNWATNDWYELKARVANEDLAAWQSQGSEYKLFKSALRSLLKERFQLEVHEEKTEVPIYNLVVAKNSDNLKPSTYNSTTVPIGGMKLASGGTMVGIRRSDGGTEWDIYYATMDDLAEFLSGMELPVHNATNLTGRYDFVLHGARHDSWDTEKPTSNFSIDHLGLKLAPSTTQGFNIVIDRIEKPSED